MLGQFLYWASRPLIGLYAQLLLKLRVIKQAPLPDGPKILVANHPSTSDPFFVALAAGQPANILITETAFKVPVFGSYLRRLGHIPVVAGNGYAAFEQAKQLLETGKTLILFPEGDLSPDAGSFRQPRTGAARLALKTGVPIIPIGIHALQAKIKYITSNIGGEWTTSRWPFRGPYTITLGKALHFKGDVENREVVREISTQIMERIAHLVQSGQDMLLSRAATARV